MCPIVKIFYFVMFFPKGKGREVIKLLLLVFCLQPLYRGSKVYLRASMRGVKGELRLLLGIRLFGLQQH